MITIFCFSCNMPFLPEFDRFAKFVLILPFFKKKILLINLCRALRRIIKEKRYYYFPNESICRKLFLWHLCPFGLRVRTTFCELFDQFPIFFQLQNLFMPIFVSKSFKCQELLFFFQKETNFFKSSFFFIFKKSDLCLKLFTVLCFCFGLRQVSHLLWGRVLHFLSFKFIFNPYASNYIVSVSVSFFFLKIVYQICHISFDFIISKLPIFQCSRFFNAKC